MEQFPNNKKEGVTRRRLLATLGIMGAGYVAYRALRPEDGFEDETSFEDDFEKEMSGYVGLVALRHDQVLFVDEDNVPIGGPVEFEDIIDDKEFPDGRVIEKYRYSAGEADETGVLTDVPTREWREKVAEQIEEAYPGRSVDRSFNVVRLYRAALQYNDEPELQDGIKDGSVVTYADLVDYYAEKPVIGAEDKNRYEYVHEEIQFREAVPSVVQDALRELLPGICAQESKFNNGLTSSAGAFGIFQFMPWVWEKYGKSSEDIKSLRVQVEVAGEFFSDIYEELLYHCDDDALVAARSLFNDQDDFLVNFIVPLVINSYNAGSARMAEAVNSYFSETRRGSDVEGKELFLQVVNAAERGTSGRLDSYGEHAREYTPRVYAHAVSIHERQSER